MRPGSPHRGEDNNPFHPNPIPEALHHLTYFHADLYNYLHTLPFRDEWVLPVTASTYASSLAPVVECFAGSTEEGFEIVYGRKKAPSAIRSDEHTPTMHLSTELPTQSLSPDEDASLPPEYQKSQRGKACGHVFKKGEGVYRCRCVPSLQPHSTFAPLAHENLPCRNCALDDTCVFCSGCFYASDHEGHDTSFAVAAGSGGCCDCGDPEAWKVPVHCQYHAPISADEMAGSMLAQADVASGEDILVTPLPEVKCTNMFLVSSE